MLVFPPLPDRSDNTAWPPDIHTAYRVIHAAYTHADNLLCLDDTDPLRMRYHLERIENDIIPMVLALEVSSTSTANGLPLEWLEAVAVCIGALVGRLAIAVEGTEHRCVCTTIYL